MTRVLEWIGDAVMLAVALVLALFGKGSSTLPHEAQETAPEGWIEHVRLLEAERDRGRL